MKSSITPAAIQEDGPFVGSLESLRGVAALMVAIAHSLLVLKINQIDEIWAKQLWEIDTFDAWVVKLMLIFANGEAAVTIFFVLSGVVLGLSLDNTKLTGMRSYLAFLVRRAFRIYPAYIVSILFVLLFLSIGIDNHNGVSIASTFFNWQYRTPLSLSQIALNLTLLDSTLNLVSWTIAVEMAVATFFPVLYFISRRWPGYAVFVVLLALIVLAVFSAKNYESVLGVLQYVYLFFIGLLIPRYGQPTFRLVFGNRIIGYKWLIFATLLFLVESQLLERIQSGFGIGAALIIFGLLHNHQHGGWKILEWHLIRKLGRQSYSFYLWHWPFLFIISWLMFKLVPFQLIEGYSLAASILLCSISVSITYWVSAISYKFIEAPSIRTGKHLVSRFI